jgi:uncharacterized protein (TIGR02757 family)
MAASFSGSKKELQEFLDFKAQQFEQPAFIATDPISLAHRFTQKEDIEIVAFFMAILAWGNRQSIIKSGEKLLAVLGQEPRHYVLNYQDGDCPIFVHRTFNQTDLNGFLLGLKAIYEQGDLENAFATNQANPTLFDHICAFRERFIPHLEARTFKHIADPANGSAAKRLVMFLRWMVRSNANGVDFGLWTSIDRSQLMIPLDVHTVNIARKLGLIQRSQNDWKTNEELIGILKEFDSVDPAKYDFALFGLGAFEKF